MPVFSYNTIESAAFGEYREKGSKFQAFAYPVINEQDVRELIAQARKAHPKAAHHCYAYRLGAELELFRFSDDREPSGSAGRPIFGVIQQQELTDILIIVVRYFGGTQLGIPGLINAYREAAADSITNAKTVVRKVMVSIDISFPVELADQIMRQLKRKGAAVHAYTSGNTGEVSCAVGAAEWQELQESFKNDFPFAGRVKTKIK